MSEHTTVISVKNLNHTFTGGEPTEALHAVTFSVQQGEFFVILGPSGCGKSTLLRILAGLARSAQGQVTFCPPEAQSHLAMVFQGFALFPWLTVEDNISFGLRMRGAPPERIEKSVQFYLEELGLREFAKQYPRQLSGGMKQRVGIARALAMDPEILLLDEPFSQLDAFTAEKLREDLLALWQKEKFTVVMVTHLIEEAILLADRIAVMTPRPGRIETIVDNTLPRPRTDREKAFWEIEDRLTAAVGF